MVTCHDLACGRVGGLPAWLPIAAFVLAGSASITAELRAEEIYRCETEAGVVYTDRECAGDSEGEVVTLPPETAGITPGPPEEVREYLAQKREERQEALRKEREWAARQPPPAPAPVVIERPVAYPYWWGGYTYRPPRPPLRPEPPVSPPVRPPLRPGGGDVLRPLR
ncbi:MAG: hypothetical protein V2I57_09825 [Xanthomonadales bacterium]|jgi:hypothetical protein|nr:hypothetical protein [Xanthomonadales bacterium]